MGKNDKKQVAVKKVGPTPEHPGVVSRVMSPLRAWESELERAFEEFPFPRWPRWRDLEPLRLSRSLRMPIPSLDMYEEKDSIIVKAELPGMSKDNIELSLRGSQIVLKGEKKREEETKEKDYIRSEREYGSFVRTLDLPAEVRPDTATATFKDGVLEVRLQKSEAAKQKEVKVAVR